MGVQFVITFPPKLIDWPCVRVGEVQLLFLFLFLLVADYTPEIKDPACMDPNLYG